MQNHADRSTLVSFDAGTALANNPYEQCFLVTPSGSVIHLVVNNRVPYFDDCASEPDLELHVSELDDEVASNDDAVFVCLPLIELQRNLKLNSPIISNHC